MTASENQIDLDPGLSAAASLGDAPVFGSASPDLALGASGVGPVGMTPVGMGPVGLGSSGEPQQVAHAPVMRPSFLFLGIVSAVTLFADIATKAWAEVAINRRGFEPIDIIDGYLSIILAYNRGGAWGLLHNASEFLRRPFFLCVSAAAILFIVSLYAKLVREQRALTWGLPLVLGGALGNLSDRISRSQVIDFIDYHADWVLKTNAWIKTYVPSWTVTDHWPTFNVADIAICLGVGLMAVDMMGPRRRHVATLMSPLPDESGTTTLDMPFSGAPVALSGLEAQSDPLDPTGATITQTFGSLEEALSEDTGRNDAGAGTQPATGTESGTGSGSEGGSPNPRRDDDGL